LYYELADEQIEETLRDTQTLSSSDLAQFDIESSQRLIEGMMGKDNDFYRLERIIGILCDRVGFGGVQQALDAVKAVIIMRDETLGEINDHPF